VISLTECVVFALTFAASAATPGPEIAALLGRALSRGLFSSAPLALGIVTGKLLMLAAAVVGVAALVATFGPVFIVLKYCGALYLVWMGIRKWRRAGQSVAEGDFTGQIELLPEVGLGIAMTLSNPIAITFYMALLPGIINPSAMNLSAFPVLASIILGVMLVVVMGYGLAAEIARKMFSTSKSKMWMDRTAGAIFITAGIWISVR
jgi:threonine/homoserine/homoserine lactone efflux protein